MGKYGKIGSFSKLIWLDWKNTTRADTAGWGSIGLRIDTGGWSVNCGALFNEASTKWPLLNYYTLESISPNSHLITLHINMLHYIIGSRTTIQIHPKLKNTYF